MLWSVSLLSPITPPSLWSPPFYILLLSSAIFFFLKLTCKWDHMNLYLAYFTKHDVLQVHLFFFIKGWISLRLKNIPLCLQVYPSLDFGLSHLLLYLPFLLLMEYSWGPALCVAVILWWQIVWDAIYLFNFIFIQSLKNPSVLWFCDWCRCVCAQHIYIYIYAEVLARHMKWMYKRKKEGEKARRQ